MTTVDFLTYNVKGLNTPAKRHRILKEIEHYGAGVVFLQETHLSHGTKVKLYSPRYPLWYYGDSMSNKSKGVAIGIDRGVRFTLVDRLCDQEGRFLFLKGKLWGMECTLVNIYCPNNSPTRFLGEILRKLGEFQSGRVINGGDLNFCMDPVLFSTSHAEGIRKTQPKAMKHHLHQFQLVDVWRLQHSKTLDFTFFSPVHGTYMRIDYWLNEHRMLDLVVSTNIEITSLSDHAPVSMTIRIPEVQRQPYTWKLNKNLLDKQGEEILKRELEQFFLVNETAEIADNSLWEAHKAYIRGILISMGARKKKERRKKREELIEEIFILEQGQKKKNYKNRNDRELQHELVLKRDELKDLLDLKMRGTFSRVAKDRYLWGNKNSKTLARILRKKRSINFCRENTK